MQDDMLRLMLQTTPNSFWERYNAWLDERKSSYRRGGEDQRELIALQIKDTAVDLRSALPLWNLRPNRINGNIGGFVNPEHLVEASAELIDLLREWHRCDLAKQANAEIAALETSNLVRLTKMTLNGQLNAWWGHDYASGLRAAMRLGASMVTTNPVLVNLAREENPKYWIAVRNKLQADNPGYGPVDLAYALTIQVVVENARMLRPLWEMSNGQIGYVSLQLSPQNAHDARKMIEEAEWVWRRLSEVFHGTPNCVFKIPGTQAGIEVACALTAAGIGVNVTVNFSLPQQIAFAGAIEKYSTTKVSYRTQMDGRLDDPIGEELEAAGISDWQEVKKWATTAIRQREYKLLNYAPQRGGLGFVKSIPLPASGRGPWNILHSLHCEPEIPISLTIFPNQQELFDSEPRELKPDGMWTPLPDGYFDKLWESKLFQQAYEPDGMTVDEFDTYLPVVRTLKQFGESYDKFLAWVTAKD